FELPQFDGPAFLDPFADGGARHPGGSCNCGNTAETERQGLAGGKEPATALTQAVVETSKPLLDRYFGCFSLAHAFCHETIRTPQIIISQVLYFRTGPKGTTAVWDDDHLVFANIRSPGTLANLRQNANVEVNVVDPFLRKGYRFKGVAVVLASGALYDQVIAF